MIDYFFKWTDQAAAKTDALMLADFLNVLPDDLYEWARDKVIPDPQVWRPSQDVDGVHTFLIGWFAVVALNQQKAVLLNASALQFALDRDAKNAGQAFVVKNNIGAMINDIRVSPIFAGSTY